MSGSIQAPAIPEFADALEAELRRRTSRRGRARRASLAIAPIAGALAIGLASWAAIRDGDPSVRIDLGDEPTSQVTGAPRAEDLPDDLPPRLRTMITGGGLLPFDTKTLTRAIEVDSDGRHVELWTAEADDNLGLIGMVESGGVVSAGLASQRRLNVGFLEECVRDPGGQPVSVCGRIATSGADIAWGTVSPIVGGPVGTRTASGGLGRAIVRDQRGRVAERSGTGSRLFLAVAPRGERLTQLRASGLRRGQTVSVPGDGRVALTRPISGGRPGLKLPRQLVVPAPEGVFALYGRSSRGGAVTELVGPGAADAAAVLNCGRVRICVTPNQWPGTWPLVYSGRVPATAARAELRLAGGAVVPMALSRGFVLSVLPSASARIERLVLLGRDGRELASEQVGDPRPRRVLSEHDVPARLPAPLRSALLQPVTDVSNIDLGSFEEALGVDLSGSRVAIWTARLRSGSGRALALVSPARPTQVVVPSPNGEGLVGCEPPGVSPVEFCSAFGLYGGIVGPGVARVRSISPTSGQVTRAAIGNGYFLFPTVTDPLLRHGAPTVTADDATGQEIARFRPYSAGADARPQAQIPQDLAVVPDLRGLDIARARAMMDSVGLRVVVRGVAGASPDGRVGSQSLDGWSGARPGSTIRLEVGPAGGAPRGFDPAITALDSQPAATGRRPRIGSRPARRAREIARLGAGYVVAEDAAQRVCLIGTLRTHFTLCRRRGALASEPVVRRLHRLPDGTATLIVLALDGFDTVVTSDGTRAKVVNNLLVMRVSPRTTGFVISGPAGRKRIAFPRRSVPSRRP